MMSDSGSTRQDTDYTRDIQEAFHALHQLQQTPRLVVTDCNRNWSGLQSTEIWDRIICIYLSLQDGILCN
jgi:hypothetical protein